ncbi:MAG: hypothetical protein AAGU27_23980 [Dehalobacterium sp.]
MPKMVCKCGEVLSYSEIPCKIEYKFISDVEYDKFQGSVDAEEIYEQMKSILKCPKCSRLWVFWNGFSKEPVEYIKAEKI